MSGVNALAAARDYALPGLLAVAVHALVAVLLVQGWSPERPTLRSVKPRIIEAQLLVARQEPKPVAAPQPAAPQPAPAPAPRARPAPEPAPPKPDDSARREREEAERLRQERERRLRELDERSTRMALDDEAADLAEGAETDAAMAYIDAIYRAVVAQWSRPPSARNDMQARLLVELVPSGDLLAVTITESSGNAAFDRSAEAAVRKVGRFEVPGDRTLFESRFRRFTLLFKPEDLLR